MDYLKSVSRGVWEQGQAEGAAEILLGLAFIVIHIIDMPSCGAEGPAFWSGGRASFYTDLQHRDGPVLGERASFLGWGARR